MTTTAKIYRSAANTGVWVEEGFEDNFVRNGADYKIGGTPFMDVEVYGRLDNPTIIYRECEDDLFTVTLRGADGQVNGTMKVSGIRVIA